MTSRASVGDAVAAAFSEEWTQVRHQVLAYCLRQMGDRDAAEDVVQAVAIRAWRGYASFERRSSFLTWVISIARREIVRAVERRGPPTTPITDDTPEPADPDPPPGGDPEPDHTWVARAVREAADAGTLSGVERDVVLARMAAPAEQGWAEIGAALGLSANVCAVTHCRAIPKLRVHLLIRWQDELGRDGIEAAFAGALADPDDPLTEDEAEAFRRVALLGDAAYRRVGWRLALRSAAEKVGRRLPIP